MPEQTFAEYAEEKARHTFLVDYALKLWDRWKHNTPSFDPEKRRFIKGSGALAGTIALEALGAGTLELLLGGCAGPEATRTGESIVPGRDWRDVLMEGDPIFGPSLLFLRGRERDYQAHLNDPTPWYGVDFNVPIGTPIVCASSGPIGAAKYDMNGGNTLGISSRAYKEAYWIQYKHLSRFIDFKIDKNNPKYRKYVELIDIVAFSGDTGVTFARSERNATHLHLQITQADPISWRHYDVLDPFTFGIDGGRPAYWDTKTNFFRPDPAKRKLELNKFFENLPQLLREKIFIDSDTKNKMLDLRSDPAALKDYLGRRVFHKNPDLNGRMSYEFLPGSDMYHLATQMHSLLRGKEFIICLPFIYPPLIEKYKSDERNKGLL